MGFPVIDAPLGLPTGKTVDCSGSAAQLSSVTGEAYLWVTNVGTTTLTLCGTGGSAGAGIAIPAGVGPVVFRVLNPSLWYGVGASGSTAVIAATTAAA